MKGGEDEGWKGEEGGREVGGRGKRRTDLIQLDQVVLCAHFAQELLGGAAVGAVGFGEDGCFFRAKRVKWLAQVVSNFSFSCFFSNGAGDGVRMNEFMDGEGFQGREAYRQHSRQ